MPEETETTTEQQASTDTTETVDETATDATDDGTESTDDAQEAETEASEKPFDRKQAEAKIHKANQEAKNLRERLKKLEPLAAELQKIKDSEKSETERLADQLAAANERIASTRQRLVRSQVQALAGGSFADPEDAVGALDLDSYIDSDGDIDEAAIKADLDALLERKPHWAKPQPQEGARRPAPDRTQASGANKPRPLTPADEFQGWLTSQLK
jgi:DNA repair exonuclease SbcCD ATPase subunit